MPVKKAAKKYIRVSKRKALKNKSAKGVLKNAIKKTQEAVKAKKIDDAKKWLKVAIKALDKASQKKILKKNTTARKKSRLNKLVKKIIKK